MNASIGTTSHEFWPKFNFSVFAWKHVVEHWGPKNILKILLKEKQIRKKK